VFKVKPYERYTQQCGKTIKALSVKYYFKNNFDFVYPPGKPMAPHLLRCRGFAVADYSFTPGRLASGAPSTFAQLG